MPTRKPHRKSRNGCIECKRRRVKVFNPSPLSRCFDHQSLSKCNEQQPCHNCLKYESECIFRTDLGQQQQCPARPKASTPKVDRNASTYVIGAMESLAGPSLSNEGRTADFEARDLELMHHFSTYVAKILSYRKEIQDAWAIELPKEAYSCDYLMHGLLALSALHLGSSIRNKRHDYIALSTYHLHKSLAGFREKLANISIENCVPLFGLSSLITIHVCAQSALERDPQPAQENSTSYLEMLMKIFNMCRGVQTVLAPYIGEIQQSSLSSLLHEDYRIIKDISRYHEHKMCIINDDPNRGLTRTEVPKIPIKPSTKNRGFLIC